MPVFDHDCKTCIYLGTFRIGTQCGTEIYDLYFHRGRTETTVIARYGNDGDCYYSGLKIPSRELLLATLTAVRKGFLEIDEIPVYGIERE